MFDRILDIADHLLMLARLAIADRFLGPLQETATDQALRERRKRLRKSFSDVDFGDRTPPDPPAIL